MTYATRRRALAWGGVAALGLLAPRMAFAQADGDPKLRQRRSIKDMASNDPDLEAYRIAVTKMRASGAWKRQVAYHADMNLLHHSSWRFLPWHRMQVIHMEKMVAKLSGKDDFAMPYWDWVDDVIPASFADDHVLTLPGRECAPGDSIADFLKANEAELQDRSHNDFATFFGRSRDTSQAPDSTTGRQHFSGSAEWGGHNLIHSFVGGDMGVLSTSPNDPLFWLHHANVDRLWADWSHHHYDGEYVDAWKVEKLSGYEDPDGSHPAPVTAETTIDTSGLGYEYDFARRPHPVGAAAPGGGRRALAPRIERYTFKMMRLSASSGVIEIPAKAARARHAAAVGYLRIDPDPAHASVTKIHCTDVADGSVPFDDKIFLVPMGMKMGLQNYRIDLSEVWSGAGQKGLRLAAATTHLAGRRSGAHPPAIASFEVDARATFYD